MHRDGFSQEFVGLPRVFERASKLKLDLLSYVIHLFTPQCLIFLFTLSTRRYETKERDAGLPLGYRANDRDSKCANAQNGIFL